MTGAAQGNAASWSTRWESAQSGPGQGELSHAYHLDAAQYAAFLRRRAERQGLVRVEGKIREVRQHASSGDVAALVLDSGQVIEAICSSTARASAGC